MAFLVGLACAITGKVFFPEAFGRDFRAWFVFFGVINAGGFLYWLTRKS